MNINNLIQMNINNLIQMNINNPIKTIPNDGRDGDMTNQCFFISILDYIKRNGYSTYTLRDVRNVSGLDIRTEHTMCDTMNDIYIDAINKICNVFELVIIVLPIDYNGKILYNGNIIDTFGKGSNIVRIAQFGLNHFELISDEGHYYRPMVTIKDVMVESSYLRNLSDKLEELYNKDAHKKTLQVLLLSLIKNDANSDFKELDLNCFDYISEVEDEIIKLIEYIQSESVNLLEEKTTHKNSCEYDLNRLLDSDNTDHDIHLAEIESLTDFINRLDSEIVYLSYLINE